MMMKEVFLFRAAHCFQDDGTTRVSGKRSDATPPPPKRALGALFLLFPNPPINLTWLTSPNSTIPILESILAISWPRLIWASYILS